MTTMAEKNAAYAHGSAPVDGDGVPARGKDREDRPPDWRSVSSQMRNAAKPTTAMTASAQMNGLANQSCIAALVRARSAARPTQIDQQRQGRR